MLLNCSALLEAPIHWVHKPCPDLTLTRRVDLAANRLTLSVYLFFHNFDLPPVVGHRGQAHNHRTTNTHKTMPMPMPTDATDENGGPLPKVQGLPPSSSHSSEGSPSSSLIMARGRSRVRRISSDVDPFSEENLRKRCVSVFGFGEQSSQSILLLLLSFRPFMITQWVP